MRNDHTEPRHMDDFDGLEDSPPDLEASPPQPSAFGASDDLVRTYLAQMGEIHLLTRPQEITLARVVQAGVVPMDTSAVCSEIQRSWNRDDAAQWAAIYAALFPSYQLLIESYTKAQAVVARREAPDAQRK